jgi:hypothetical protein
VLTHAVRLLTLHAWVRVRVRVRTLGLSPPSSPPPEVQAPAGGFLHRFSWIKDDELIGKLPTKWNFLVGWHDKSPTPPGAVHYTLGGPWFPDYRHAPPPLNDWYVRGPNPNPNTLQVTCNP